jgi:conjugal transfer mating pair stabilization protein TraN
LGLGFGTVKNPDCSGLTIAQVQSIDFSQVDFSEAIADIQANIKTPTNATNRATTKINNYFTP